MSPALLDLTPFSRVLQRLAEGLVRYQSDTGDTQIRDGLIQRFEFTYEISHKMLKRYLESASANRAVFDAMPFADLIRIGNEQGLLLGNWNDWKRYREMRSRTSHAYDEEVALGVVEGIPAFLAVALFLLQQLQGRTAE
jgi:nucleotidyltransferase substrate binding protein (TIGR01987 family)